ncbi:hypothetical protein ACIOJD_31005 [Streptomyces sp. NPDC088116]|uniref:hypothetical protein n=1 Tax=Streptomyces sp. NPDC088116 TaxID=3365825 RepID=UPI003827E0E6
MGLPVPLLNEGLRSRQIDLARWVIDPDASDSDIIDAMRIPSHVSVEGLLMEELQAVSPYHEAWTAISGTDTQELFLRNSTCKRALYLSAPIFLPDSIPVDTFAATGVNERIHVYEAEEVRDTVRLEAISSYRVGGFRFRYALSIQYKDDSVGLGWQVIRPVIVFDRRLLAMARDSGPQAVASLLRILECLGKLILFGSHDYVHATVLNWFPPVKNLKPAYAAIASERRHPPEVDVWHRGSQEALPAHYTRERETPGIATLELYSLLVHGQVVAWIWDRDPRVRETVHAHVRELHEAFTDFLRTGVFGEPDERRSAAEYVTTLAGWFLASALEVRSERMAEALGSLPADAVDLAYGHLTAVHGGMFDFVGFADPDRFPWRGRFVVVHEVTAEYEAALRLPALRGHLHYLSSRRKQRTPSPATAAGPATSTTWIEDLCAPLQEAERATLLASLHDLTSCRSRADWETGLGRLKESGQLMRLRALGAGQRAGATGGTTAHGTTTDGDTGTQALVLSCARAVLTGFVDVAESVLASCGPVSSA